MDPEFPKRLQRSGYLRSVEFIEFLFKDYAQASLTRESDREIALSGLTMRMESVFRTECRYGILKRFLIPLLLWRVREPDDVSQELALPSWSWMTHRRIDFLDFDFSMVPPETALRFGPEKDSLFIEVRELTSYTIERRDEHFFLKAGAEIVGELWFDTRDKIQSQHCVVIAMARNRIWSEAGDSTCYILLIRKGSKEGQYERIGIGQVWARFVSYEYVEGSLL